MAQNEYEELAEILDLPFSFRHQPDPVPPSLRPGRRVPLLVLLVAKCHGAGASWTTLQLLNWTVRNPEHAELLVTLRDNVDIPDRPIVRFEPALDRAIDLATGLGFLEQKSARVFKLTSQGKKLVSEVEKSDAFLKERQMLALFPGKMTQREVARLLDWRVK